MVHQFRSLSKDIAFLVIIALLINIPLPMYSQSLWEKAQTTISKGASAVGKAFQDIDVSRGLQVAGKAIKDLDIPGKLQEVALSVSSKIKNSLSEKVEQLKDVAPKVLIPKLLENIDKFGQQIGYVANCMFKGECSEQERAAFIALSITILALTIALVGFSLTVAATSKEIDAETVIISEQVKGWSPSAIVARLKNTAAEFKQNLSTLQTCLLKRQCTKTQKKGLYGFAITIVVLTTIIVGIGVGSYIYAQQKEKERAEIAAQEAAARRAAEAAQGIRPQEQKPITPPIKPEEKPQPKPSLVATLQEQAKSTVASVRDQAKAQINQLQELAQDWKKQVKDKVTPIQDYFQKQVIEKGTNAVQETATKIQEALATQMEAAQQALKATAANVQATLIEKAYAAHAQAKELGEKFLIEMEKSGRSFFEAALDKVLNVHLSVIEPAIKTVQEYTKRLFKAIEPLYKVRLKDQINQLTDDLNTLLEKSALLQNQWQTAASQLTQRTPWIKSHVRPVALGGKTNEQIEQEAKTMFPLAYVADDIWNFYPKVVNQVNDLKLYGPALIFDSFAKRTAEFLDAVHALHTSIGKVGIVIISRELASALQDLKNQLLKLGADIKATASIKPILSNPPQSTAAALMEAFKGFTWRVGFGLPYKMNDYIDKMLQQYNEIMPLLEAINAENEALQNLSNNISVILKTDVKSRIDQQPIINTARLPIILAHSLGAIVSQMKALINNILLKTDTVIGGLGIILENAKPMTELINTAFGANFINPGIIQGLDTIGSDVQNLKGTIQKIRQGITDALQLPAGL